MQKAGISLITALLSKTGLLINDFFYRTIVYCNFVTKKLRNQKIMATFQGRASSARKKRDGINQLFYGLYGIA